MSSAGGTENGHLSATEEDKVQGANAASDFRCLARRTNTHPSQGKARCVQFAKQSQFPRRHFRPRGSDVRRTERTLALFHRCQICWLSANAIHAIFIKMKLSRFAEEIGDCCFASAWWMLWTWLKRRRIRLLGFPSKESFLSQCS